MKLAVVVLTAFPSAPRTPDGSALPAGCRAPLARSHAASRAVVLVGDREKIPPLRRKSSRAHAPRAARCERSLPRRTPHALPTPQVPLGPTPVASCSRDQPPQAAAPPADFESSHLGPRRRQTTELPGRGRRAEIELGKRGRASHGRRICAPRRRPGELAVGCALGAAGFGYATSHGARPTHPYVQPADRGRTSVALNLSARNNAAYKTTRRSRGPPPRQQ